MPLQAAFDLDRSMRLAIGCAATLRDASQTPVDVVVEDISRSGCRFTTDFALPLGETITIGIPGIGTHRADIRRVDRPHYGCAFLVPITTDEIAIAHVADTLVHADFVTGAPTARPPARKPDAEKLSLRTRAAFIVGSSIMLWLSFALVAKLLIF